MTDHNQQTKYINRIAKRNERLKKKIDKLNAEIIIIKRDLAYYKNMVHKYIKNNLKGDTYY